MIDASFCTDYELSIHFPLTREDMRNPVDGLEPILSIHFPLTREDTGKDRRPGASWNFQSTSLSRGKTSSDCP